MRFADTARARPPRRRPAPEWPRPFANPAAICPGSPTPSPRPTSRTPPSPAPAATTSYELPRHPSHPLRIRRARVTCLHHVARLEPRATAAQERREFAMEISPAPALPQGAHRLFRQPTLLLQHPGGARTSRDHHLQPRSVRANPAPPPEASPGVGGGRPPLPRSRARPRSSSRYQFVFDSPHVRASFDLARLRAAKFPQGRPCSPARRTSPAASIRISSTTPRPPPWRRRSRKS